MVLDLVQKPLGVLNGGGGGHGRDSTVVWCKSVKSTRPIMTTTRHRSKTLVFLPLTNHDISDSEYETKIGGGRGEKQAPLCGARD